MGKLFTGTLKRGILVEYKRYIKDFLYWLIGCAVYAFSVVSLLEPNKISPGGFAGVATVLSVVLTLPSGTILLLLNVPLMLFAFKKLGGGFILKTVAVTFILSFLLNIGEIMFPKFELNPVLAAVFGGIISGFGLSLILLRGATTGGVDIIAIFVNSKRPHFSVGRIIMIFDAFVIALAALVYSNIESALFSLVTIYAATQVMDNILYGADKGKIVLIVTKNSEEIINQIAGKLNRGVTKISSRGGFTNEENEMLFCAVRKYEVANLVEIIKSADNNAFTVITDAGEIIGQGFKNI